MCASILVADCTNTTIDLMLLLLLCVLSWRQVHSSLQVLRFGECAILRRENLRRLLDSLSYHSWVYTKRSNSCTLDVIQSRRRIIILVDWGQSVISSRAKCAILLWRRCSPIKISIAYAYPADATTTTTALKRLIKLVVALIFQEFIVLRAQMLNVVPWETLRILRLKLILMIVVYGQLIQCDTCRAHWMLWTHLCRLAIQVCQRIHQGMVR